MPAVVARANKPPRILLYGPPGTGKTTLAQEFPNAVFLQIEDGTPADLEIASWVNEDQSRLKTFEDVDRAIQDLYTSEDGFETVVIDSVDKLEPWVWEAACKPHGWKSVEEPGYGRGYVEADKKWREILEGLNALRNDRGMTIILIAHSHIVKFPNPQGAEYLRWDIRLHKRAIGLIQDEVDCILMLNQDTNVAEEKGAFGAKHSRAVAGGRYINTSDQGYLVAKNRYGMPSKIPYRKGSGFAELAQYFPHIKHPAQAA